MKKVLFVCLGNICRSPAAEGVMKSFISKAGLDDQIYVDSCGTLGHHEGERADHRMRTHATQRGYDLQSIARGIRKQDLNDFDYIITMDKSNYSNVLKLDDSGEFKDKIIPMTQFCEKVSASEVPDPYYGGPDGFEHVLDILEDACTHLLERIKGDL